MYRTVIVPLDGSARAERAASVAASFARRALAVVDLVTVSNAAAASPELRAATEHDLQKVAAGLTAEVGQTAVLYGVDPAAEILAYARTRPDPLICMTTHARGRVGELLLGSVAEGVLRKGDLPVLLVGPKVRRDAVPVFDLMLVCLDGSDFAEAILPVARAWNDTIGIRPWLVQVLEPAAVERAGRAGNDVQETSYLRRTAARFAANGIAVDYDVVHHASPAAGIARFAADLPASVVAVTTHGRTGVRRTVLGSVAMGVVHRAACPVLVLRPAES